MYKVNQIVFIVPLQENCIITKIRKDDLGVPIIEVIRNTGMDDTIYLCRECEISIIP